MPPNRPTRRGRPPAPRLHDTVRLSADNIGLQPQRLDRRFFTPNRFPGGVFNGREFRESDSATPIYALTVSGSF